MQRKEDESDMSQVDTTPPSGPDIYQALEGLGITDYQRIEHPPVHTVEELAPYTEHLLPNNSKNLFLRNEKGNAHYLVVADADTQIDIKNLTEFLGERRLSFASPERLKRYLGVIPGAVSAFGLIHDQEKAVQVLIDNNLLRHEKLAFHPNSNTETIVIKTADFRKYLSSTGNNVRYVNLPGR